MTETSIGVEYQQLKCLLSIQYLVILKKSHIEIYALIDSGNKVNIITPSYMSVVGLRVCPTNNKAQNIDKYIFLTHDIILANFQLKNK